MTPDDLWEKLARRLAETTERLVVARIEVFLTRFMRSQLKVIYSESEAAAFLGVSKDTLSHWRKRRIIAFAQYPQARAQDPEDSTNDMLSDMYSYSVADLLNFREKYLIREAAAPNNVYEISKSVSVLGPEVKRIAA